MDQFDIIFGGGGTTACVTAGRLAAANPSLRILVLEAGEHTKEQDAHTVPGNFLRHLPPPSTTMSYHVGQPSKALGGRTVVVPSAKCVGGGGSLNFMIYTRPSASDYDDWERVYKNPGWGAKDLLPLIKKMETYDVEPDKATHGYSGPLKVSWGGSMTNVGLQFFDVAAAIDTNREVTEDVNDFVEVNKYGKWPKWIDAKSGRRSDTAHYYLYNQDDNPNLVILSGQKVKRVLFDGNKATGIEYVADTALRPDADQNPRRAYASRLVVLSAGTFGSPTILERSGVGAANILKKHNVPVIVDLPGVGATYQDHNILLVPYQASDDAETYDALIRGEPAEHSKQAELWKEGKGLLASNGTDAGIKLRPTQAELEELGPEFEGRWKSYFADAPDKAVLWVGICTFLLLDIENAAPRKYYSAAYMTLYPVSTGSLHISSGENPHAAHDFDPAFLSDRADLAVLRLGYKKSREIARRMGFYQGEYTPIHPKFAPESEAFCRADADPVPMHAPDINYTEEDDKAIEDFHKQFVHTSWHSIGTCAMKPREDGGVVDSRLNVYGTMHLKVADLSICPGNVGANTFNTAVTVGEKAAVLIAEDFGLKL